jgi:periplasmic divalent cation tolerance protein
MFIAWTTVGSREEADRLAAGVVAQGLAACAQIDGPIISHYRWQGRPERAEEFRLTFKCTAARLADLEAHVLAHHPYDTPEWLAIAAERVGEKYLSWAEANSTNPPL